MKARELFGEFLVRRAEVTEDQLAAALVDQIRGLPSVCEVVFDAKALSAGQILAALKKQTLEGVDFVSACRELGFWNEKIQALVVTEIAGRRVPIGQILVQKNALSASALGKSVEEYLNQEEVPPERVPAQPAPHASVEPDSSMVGNFCELFSSGSRANLDGLVQDLAVKNSWDGTDASSIELIRQLLGAAQLADLSECRSYLSALLGSWEKKLPPDREGWLENVILGLNLLWSGRNEWLKSGSAPQWRDLRAVAETLEIALKQAAA